MSTNMATMKANPSQQQCVLAEVAADEAALDVEIEMALQRYRGLYNHVQMQEVKIAARKKENELWDKLIEAKNLELDKIMKTREDVQKRTESLKQSSENSKRLHALLQERRAKILEQRESIRARYCVLINKTKAKISKYPLVVERDQLKNELLAANIELGVLKYRNADKKRQNKLMKEIHEKQENNAIVDLARLWIKVKKLEEEKLTLLQELEEANKNSLIQSEGQDKINAAGTTAEDWTNKLPSDETINVETGFLPANEQLSPSVRSVQSHAVDDILKNFHAKLMTRTPSVLPPCPVLSLERRYNRVKPDQSAQVISANANEKSEGSEKNTSEEEMSRTGTGEECIQSNPAEMVTRRDESATNDSMMDANVPPTSTDRSNSSEGKRALSANAALRKVKFMRTDDFIGAKRLSERYQYAASHAIDQGRGGQFTEHIAYHSGGRLVKKPPLQNIHSAATTRARKEMESTLSPEKTGSYPTAQENNVSSTFFNEKPNEKAGKNLPVPVRRYYAYDEYDHRGTDYGNVGANRRANAEMVPGGKRSAEDFAAGEQRGYVLEDEFDFRSDNGNAFENYSDRNDEIDADEAGVTAFSRVDGSRTTRTNPAHVPLKRKSSYEGIFPGPSLVEPPRSDHDLFGSPKQSSSSPHPFDNISHHSGDDNDREDFNFF